MLVSEALTNIRATTSHDVDDQVSTAQMLAWIQAEQDRIRRRLSTACPTLYNAVYAPAGYTLTGTSVTLALPTTYLAMVRMEKLFGSTWRTMLVADGLDASGLLTGLEFREQGTDLIVAPVESAPGSYRLTHVTTSAVLTSSPDTTIEVPAGLADVVCERVAARVFERCKEDPTSSIKRADDIWRDVFPSIKQRYGAHTRPGLRRIRDR